MSEMEAGQKLDALVAEKVMGWAITHRGHRVMPGPGGIHGGREMRGFTGSVDARTWISQVCPDYSTDISAAWEVVEKLKERHGVTLSGGPNDEGGCEGWVCSVKAFGYRRFQDQEWNAHADTAPLAICKAALQAVAHATTPESEVSIPAPHDSEAGE